MLRVGGEITTMIVHTTVHTGRMEVMAGVDSRHVPSNFCDPPFLLPDFRPMVLYSLK